MKLYPFYVETMFSSFVVFYAFVCNAHDMLMGLGQQQKNSKRIKTNKMEFETSNEKKWCRSTKNERCRNNVISNRKTDNDENRMLCTIEHYFICM